MKTGEFQAHAFRESRHEVEALHRLSRGAFHEIVYGADNDQSVRIRFALETDIAVVRSGEKLRLRVPVDSTVLLDDSNEGFVAIGISEYFPDVLFRDIRLQEYVTGCQYAPDHLDGCSRKVNCRARKGLLHLRDVAMSGRLVRAYRPASLWMMARVARRIAAFTRPGLYLHNGGLDEIALVQWGQCQYRRRGVATRARDELGAS